MYAKTLFKLATLVVVTTLLVGCATSAPTSEPRESPPVEQLAWEVPAEAPVVEYESVAATAPPNETGPGPSTGGTDEPNDQPYGDVFFEDYGVNPFIDTEDDHFSTFAVVMRLILIGLKSSKWLRVCPSYTDQVEYLRFGFLYSIQSFAIPLKFGIFLSGI